MKRSMFMAVALVAVGLLQSPVSAEVADSAANGFTIKITLNLQSSPDTAYQQFFAIANWWDPNHTYSGDAHNLSMEQKAMGCFCESLPKGGGVRHMEVVLLKPGKMIVLSGGLGPLQSLAATARMKIVLSPAAGGGTKVDVSYSVGGYLPSGLNTFAAPVNDVLTQQFTRFKSYVETGSPGPKKQP